MTRVLQTLFICCLLQQIAVAQSLDMTCSIHGFSNMHLKFELEEGDARSDVEIIGGNSGAKWELKVGGADVSIPGSQELNDPGIVKLRVGDTVTFKVTGSFHGILFKTEELARDFFNFGDSQPLADRTPVGDFGWGTEGKGPGTTLAVATVQPAGNRPTNPEPSVLDMTCSIHGDDRMTLRFELEEGAARNDIEIIGGNSPSVWVMKIGGVDTAIPGEQKLDDPGVVKLRVGDQITFKVEGNAHGILFKSEEAAESFFEFGDGQPRGNQSPKGDFDWGTGGAIAGTTLAQVTVREQANGGPKPTVPLDMTCSIHGNNQMTLRFELEEGEARDDVELIGSSSPTKWSLKIGGNDVSIEGSQSLADPGIVKLRAGDKLTFKVDASVHGILFKSEDAARDFFEFDDSQPLAAQTPKGEFAWGTGGFTQGTTLANVTVKEQGTIEPQPTEPVGMTCSAHGDNLMTLRFEIEPGDARDDVEIIGTSSIEEWSLEIGGENVTIVGEQTRQNPGVIKLRNGDKVTFKVDNSFHGILFESEEVARGFLNLGIRNPWTTGRLSANSNGVPSQTARGQFWRKRPSLLEEEFPLKILRQTLMPLQTEYLPIFSVACCVS